MEDEEKTENESKTEDNRVRFIAASVVRLKTETSLKEEDKYLQHSFYITVCSLFLVSLKWG